MDSVAIAAIFKNEAPFFQEWIEYHRLLGVSHFYLYNNGSEDGWREALAPYREEVTVIEWPDQRREEWKERKHAWVYTTQVAAYEHAFLQAKETWVAALDVDEFLVPQQVDSLPQLLGRYSAAPGVEAYWQVHGTSGVPRIPAGRLLIETLRMKMFFPCWQGKTILQPRAYRRFSFPPHRCEYAGGQSAEALAREELVINHYPHRGEEHFFAHKIKNKERMDNVTLSRAEIALSLALGNDVDDREGAILRFAPQLRKKIFN